MSDKLTNESISRLVAKRDIFGDDLGNFEFLEDYVKLNGYKSGYKESLYMCYCRGCKLMARYFEGIGYFEIGSRKFRRIITKNGRFAKRK